MEYPIVVKPAWRAYLGSVRYFV